MMMKITTTIINLIEKTLEGNSKESLIRIKVAQIKITTTIIKLIEWLTPTKPIGILLKELV